MGYAVIMVDYKYLADLPGCVIGGEGYFDGDIWIEPERRYNLALLKEWLGIENKGWHLYQTPAGSVVYPELMRAAIAVIVEGADLPDVPKNMRFPIIYPTYRYQWHDRQYLPTVFSFDMSEVEKAQSGNW